MDLIERDERKMEEMNILCCSHCHGALVESGDVFSCPNCGELAKRKGPVVDFSRDTTYWSYISRPLLARLVEVAANEGVKTALEKVLSPLKYEDYLLRLLDEGRGDFRFLLPATSSGCVLDLGSGWGGVTLALSRQFQRVVAADATRENLEFLVCRAREAQRSNILFLCIDPLEHSKLPLRDGSFTAVILNGLLEWVGSRPSNDPPRAFHVRLLQEVRRILRPDGCVYLGIENRFGAMYWLGKPDPHAQIPFVSVLPRQAADLLSYIVRGKPYRNYTYSYNGLRRLFREAGFGNLEFYMALPSYGDPQVMIPLAMGPCLRYWIRNIMVPRRRVHGTYAVGLLLLSLLGIQPYLVPDFAVIARR
jgi:SAM-dependent methyltransferase